MADYCQEVLDFRGAIEFLLIANKFDEAFRLAQTHNQVWLSEVDSEAPFKDQRVITLFFCFRRWRFILIS